ncbi:MAG: peptidoglycan-binding protein [Streptosporangiaceae bacterium]|nr:peptidoglycan-binding protein [Streptosporangiaceae bacterium]
MSQITPSQSETSATQEFSTAPATETRRSRRRIVIAGGVVVVVAAAGAAVAVTDPFAHSSQSNGVTDNATPTALATVTQGTLSQQTDVNATLGYAESYTVINRANGVYTSLPKAGQVFSRGQVMYRVSGGPVILLYGSVPAYRTLSEGMRGRDVEQLNANLVALGYATRSELNPRSHYFGSETQSALESLQKYLGITQNGTLTADQAVFLPSAVRVTSIQGQLGGAAGPGAPVFAASSTTRQVTVALDASEQSYVKDGDKVTITLPNNQTTPGLVSSVGTVAATASGSSTPTVTVDVTPTNPSATGSLDQAPVQVSITTATVDNALSVPVDALLALAGGGYGVEVVGARGVHRVVPVTLGLFDDQAGTVQVSGSGLAAGERVVVPAT